MFHFAFDMTQARRWIVLCLATVVLHLGALNWAGQHLSRPDHPDVPAPPVQVRLRPAAPAPRPAEVPAVAAQPVPQKPQLKRQQPRPASARAATLSVVKPPQAATIDMPTLPPAPAIADTPAQQPPAERNAGAEVPPATTPVPADTPPPAPLPPASPAKSYRINLPPSLEINYAVSKGNLKDENASKTEGNGIIRWFNLGQQYRIEGDAKILFATLFSFQSEGEITGSGITPLIYTEKRAFRAPTNTHFQRQRNVISFSASTREFPRSEGAQDRASMLWQLTGIGRGNSEKMSGSSVIEFVVASEREAELWQFHVLGQESLQLGNSELIALHLQRAPPDGSFGSKIDVWLSPQHEWAPVRILQTDSNGNTTEMIMTKFTLNNNAFR